MSAGTIFVQLDIHTGAMERTEAAVAPTVESAP